MRMSDQTPAGWDIGVEKAGVRRGRGQRRTTPRSRVRGGVVRIYEGFVEGCFIGGRTRCVESIMHLPDLELLPNLALVILNAWHIRSPSEGPSNLARDPGVARRGSTVRTRLITHLSKSSSATFTDSSRLLAFLPWTTVFSTSHTLKQYSDSCVESLSSSILSWLGYQRGSEGCRGTRKLTRTRARAAPTVWKTCFAEEASTAFLFKILILSSRSDTSASHVCVAIFAGLV